MGLLDSASHAYGNTTRLQRELLLFVIMLVFGLFGVPLLISAVGLAVLGPYANGGPAALLTDSFRYLAQGSLVYWVVAIGPYLMVLFLRGIIALVMNRSSPEPQDQH